MNFDLTILKTMNTSDNNKPTKQEMLEVIQDKLAVYGYYGATDWELTPSPVVIGDVLHYFSRDMVASTPIIRFRRILEKWNFYEKPINEQSLECIEYFYNLVK